MTSGVCHINVPLCGCVQAARKLSTIFQIPSKYKTEGSATGADAGGPLYGSFMVMCDWCGTILKCVDAHDFAKPIELHESVEFKVG